MVAMIDDLLELSDEQLQAIIHEEAALARATLRLAREHHRHTALTA